MGNLSFREKSLLGSLVGLVLVSGLYFSRVLGMALDGTKPSAAGIVLVVLMVGLVFHIMGNAWFEREEWISPLIVAHLILLSLVIYQVVDYLSQLIAYRRGH